jgi:hypothetical protein
MGTMRGFRMVFVNCPVPIYHYVSPVHTWGTSINVVRPRVVRFPMFELFLGSGEVSQEQS